MSNFWDLFYGLRSTSWGEEICCYNGALCLASIM